MCLFIHFSLCSIICSKPNQLRSQPYFHFKKFKMTSLKVLCCGSQFTACITQIVRKTEIMIASNIQNILKYVLLLNHCLNMHTSINIDSVCFIKPKYLIISDRLTSVLRIMYVCNQTLPGSQECMTDFDIT